MIRNLFTLACLSLLAITATAQERAAAGAAETQMTWSALSTQINAVSGKADAVNSRVDQIVVCGKKGMVYAPGAAGADAQGCLGITPDLSAVNTAITNLTNALNSTTANTNNLLVCNGKGMAYDPTNSKKDAQGCVTIGGGTGFDNMDWHDVGSQRKAGATYRNKHDTAIQVVIVTGYHNAYPDVSPDGNTWMRVGTGGGSESTQTYTIIPKGWYYRLNNSNGNSDGCCGYVGFYSWMELY